jgi:hypothetical protein
VGYGNNFVEGEDRIEDFSPQFDKIFEEKQADYTACEEYMTKGKLPYDNPIRKHINKCH